MSPGTAALNNNVAAAAAGGGNKKENSKEEREKSDQLNIIFDVIGTPSSEEQLEEFLESAESVDYVRKM